MSELIPCAVCSTRAYIGQIRTLFVPRALMNILPVSASMHYRYRKSRVLDNEYAIGTIKIEEGDAIHIITLRFDSDEDKWILTVPISSNTIQIFKSTSFHGVFLRLFYGQLLPPKGGSLSFQFSGLHPASERDGGTLGWLTTTASTDLCAGLTV